MKRYIARVLVLAGLLTVLLWTVVAQGRALLAKAEVRLLIGSRGSSTGRPESAPNLDWAVELADAPRRFDLIGNRSLALDSAGRPHLAYGGENLYYAWSDGSTWHIQIVDPMPRSGYYTSLALDAEDHPHISYEDNGRLKYATYDGAAWKMEIVEQGAGTIDYTNLALDAAGRPHISYYDGGNFRLKYAWLNGSTWVTETVDGNGLTGWYSSLAIDSLGRPHISYCEMSGGGYCRALRYAYRLGSTWTIEIVDTAGGNVGAHTSLAVDALNQPHISYVQPGQLKYAHRPAPTGLDQDTPTWQIDIVDSSAAAVYTSLVLNSAAEPRIAYLSTAGIGDYTLRYAEYADLSWHLESLTGLRYEEAYVSLALDGAERPWISYADFPDFYLAHKDGATWSMDQVDRQGFVGSHSSLALDPFGQAHVSYYDDYGRCLKYAHRAGAAWQVEFVDTTESTGEYSSLALDQAGRPHISYYYSAGDWNGALRYAHYDGSTWQIETVDSSPDRVVGIDTSLALDAAGQPHISYIKDRVGANSALAYAYNQGAAWHIEVVDSPTVGSWGGNTSLALDPAGRPHIAYAGGNGSLRYAWYDGTAWQTATVESQISISDVSLALDSAGQPHISYKSGEDGGQLKYASYDGVAWQIVIVDDSLAGDYSSLALDADDRPHISYFAIWQGLKYAYFDGTVWQSETVQAGWETGPYTSLKLDRAGRPYISYQDGYPYADLKVASICMPVSHLRVQGPGSLLVGQIGTYVAVPQPITASLPLTFTWDNGTRGVPAYYTWLTNGVYTLSVTGTNQCGQGHGSMQVHVIEEWPYRFYVPVLSRGISD